MGKENGIFRRRISVSLHSVVCSNAINIAMGKHLGGQGQDAGNLNYFHGALSSNFGRRFLVICKTGIM